jgi:alanine racemase
MVDVTDVDCKVGDNIEVFGNHIPVENLAETRGTIPYEILTSISNRVKRVYYRE